MEAICPTQLFRWPEVPSPMEDTEQYERLLSKPALHEDIIFPVDPSINQKVLLWCGNALHLMVDAIVNPTDGHLCSRSRLCADIYRHAGPDMRHKLDYHIKHCPVGEVKVSKGHSIRPRYILHTTSPTYKPKYHTASEEALFYCYFNVFQKAKECKLRTLALGPLAIGNFPKLDATNLGMRVLRRFLEHFPDAFDMVIFVLDDIYHYELYRNTLKLYFPRNEEEERLGRHLLPNICGGALGEPIIPARAIRIKESPLEKMQEHSEDSGLETDQHSYCSEYSSESDAATETGWTDSLEKLHNLAKAELNPRPRSHTARSFFSFGTDSSSENEMNDEDKQRLASYQCELKLQRLERRARRMERDLDPEWRQKLASCIFASQEHEPNATLTIIAHPCVLDPDCSDYVLCRLMSQLNKVSHRPYVVIYLHTTLTGATPLESAKPLYLSKLLTLLTAAHRDNLKSFHVVYPSVSARLYLWWLTTFDFKFLKNKLHYVTQLTLLKECVSPDWFARLPPASH